MTIFVDSLEPIHNVVVNEDIQHFLHKLRKVSPERRKTKLRKKAIYRSAITLIANSAQKDREYGQKTVKASAPVPKIYMPVPQASQVISHVLGKGHVPYSQDIEDLRHTYNYKVNY